MVLNACLINRRSRFNSSCAHHVRMRPMKKVTSLGFLILALTLTACGAGKIACQVIKTANEACTIIEMIGADGKVVQVPVTNEELAGFGKMASARRQAEKQAGVPMGAALPAPTLKPDAK